MRTLIKWSLNITTMPKSCTSPTEDHVALSATLHDKSAFTFWTLRHLLITLKWLEVIVTRISLQWNLDELVIVTKTADEVQSIISFHLLIQCFTEAGGWIPLPRMIIQMILDAFLSDDLFVRQSMMAFSVPILNALRSLSPVCRKRWCCLLSSVCSCHCAIPRMLKYTFGYHSWDRSSLTSQSN